MPTETQLEQRVAALQSDLNERDQRTDGLQFQLKDREGSRRDWFEAAQAAEKRIEWLESELLTLKRAVWHALDNSGDADEAFGDVKIMKKDFEKLCDLVPEDWHDAKVEAVAKEIYESWVRQPGFTPWVDGGNSLKQDEARKAARAQLSTEQATEGASHE